MTTTPWWGKLTSRLGTDQNCRAGIIAREGGAASNYLFALDATGNFQLLRGTGPPSGASGDCAPAASGLGALPEGIWVTLRLRVSGQGPVTLETWADDVPIHNCTHSTSVRTAGGAGLLVYSAGAPTLVEFDDVRVSQP